MSNFDTTNTVELPSWEQMSELEQAQCTYWDMYKDAYGVRPRGIDTSAWTVADFENEFASLGSVIERNEAARIVAEENASRDFESRIQMLLSCGAVDYQMALRWIHEAHNTGGDDDFLAWELGLKYGYFRSNQ